MGLIQSIFCSVTFCVERVLTWTCCAFLLMLMMFTIIVLMVYGIAVGYHYAQKELASFAVSSRSTTLPPGLNLRRAGESGVDESQPVVRLVAVNRSEVEHAPHPELEVYQRMRPGEKVYMDASPSPIVILETERPPKEPELSPQEKDLARRLIGRFRRSRNNTATAKPFLRPLRAVNVTSTSITIDFTGFTSVRPLT
ncbi:uncharacterized protein LOC128674834 [Plodia interpunctella]|uniref:uncharacterized protein LOC128674834 n=1 Tax=Plodia interpunctella TaxID=58824 RepID=UPI0023684EF2|nr:uncharacterized protein LOC128674834 [Plodia interpunctella]XP_053609743.1 uncharacterized protein LOC128674834 [Plodia interpunctella]XP_053609744.1 uncharacterized protein LOC128674834 [Plodia interpunctella]